MTAIHSGRQKQWQWQWRPQTRPLSGIKRPGAVRRARPVHESQSIEPLSSNPCSMAYQRPSTVRGKIRPRLPLPNLCRGAVDHRVELEVWQNFNLKSAMAASTAAESIYAQGLRLQTCAHATQRYVATWAAIMVESVRRRRKTYVVVRMVWIPTACVDEIPEHSRDRTANTSVAVHVDCVSIVD